MHPTDETGAPPGAPAQPAASDPSAQTEALVSGSGSYELLKKRLETQGEGLQEKTQELNEQRLAEFGRSDQTLILRTRARTENNAVARDLVRIGDLLLLGYNVFIGLRKETAVGDVFGLYRLVSPDEAGAESDELQPVPLAGTFLEDARFASDFRELYAYYKQATLVQLRVTQDKLLAAFQIGQQITDVRVFRWAIERDGRISYIDNRGERDIALPASHDFEWTVATREDHVGGKHPHVNVLDTVFVETLGGDLTVKIENNTETGLGIYSEPVEDRSQSLTDAEIAWAKLGMLILLRVKPYREQVTRYLVFNIRTQQVERIDAIGGSCVQLPEDHGIIFPGGYYLQSGEHKRFDLPAETVENLRFKRMLRSPNGEDVAYIFYDPKPGRYALFNYNLIDKKLATPIIANGYARFADGRILVFHDNSGEPSRVHPMQLWQTPFASEEHVSAQPPATGFFGKIGNAELVRGVSDLMGIARAVREQAPTKAAYEDLIRQCTRVSDAYFWLDAPEAAGLMGELRSIAEVARSTLAEFEKVDTIRRETARALARAEDEQHALLVDIASTIWRAPDDFVKALARLRERRGALQMLKELRYADLPRIAAMDAALATEQQRIGERAMQFLAADTAFAGQRQALDKLALELPNLATSPALGQLLATLDEQAAGLDLLTEQLGSLPGGDAVIRTSILDRISLIYADINRMRADARARRKSLGATEARAEFGAQFKLFSQAVENALEFADTPEKCDDALTRLLAQLEEIEGRFAEQEDFLRDIAEKRENVYEALSARRQSLVDARQRRAQGVVDAAGRILDGIPRRIAQFGELTQVHSYFAADPMIGKLHTLIADLRTLGAAVPADELDTRLKTARDQALRAVRDKRELVSEGGDTLRLGRHAFTVHRQPVDLTLVAREDGMAYQVTGTDYQSPVDDERLRELHGYWNQSLVSETPELSRAEYLAGRLLESLLDGKAERSWTDVRTLLAEDPQHPQLLEMVRRFAAARYQEGYQKGIHDDDALRLLGALVAMQDQAGLLAWGPTERALALLYWQHGHLIAHRESLLRRARAAMQMSEMFGRRDALEQLEADTARSLNNFVRDVLPDLLPLAGNATQQERDTHDGRVATLCEQAAAYLARELAAHAGETWVVSGAGEDLAATLLRELERGGRRDAWQADLDAAPPAERWRLARDWVHAYALHQSPESIDWVDDAASVLAMPLQRTRVNVALDRTVEGLRGEHPRVADGRMTLNLNDFWRRFLFHATHVVPGFEALGSLRHELLEREKARLKLSQFQAKPLSTFVRNRLIDELYLPIIGDNLAKQIGSAGEGSRTDRMGLLLLISPPGYGKTTLMEYVADRLGLIFVRINCPALGHGVSAIDPANAPNSAARQELEKLNLGLAMGSNVMLYLDDIQHTSPEFLQKFIALADGTRRIEGVWNGEPRSYDMRGKRFAIVMAGNPYTESGDVFKIPDMLANRADIYNLGDVLSGREAAFALSYIENSLTSNPTLMPLASRDPKDVQLLVQMAQGHEVPSSALSHAYSAVELEEIKTLLQRLFRARDLLLKVNLAYIESAAQQEAYRTAPPFKLQGSYRNMTKLAGKITALMRDDELDALLRDHYRGEAQTLTTGAEENLLRLAQLLGSPTPEESARWQVICEEFVRQRKLGGADVDGSQRIASSMLDVARAVDGLKPVPVPPAEGPSDSQRLADAMLQIAVTYRELILPLVTATERRLELDRSITHDMKRLSAEMQAAQAVPKRTPKNGKEE
ncbi:MULTISPECIES: DNA repair ATPase [Variovorax]|jgi:MoxR-like ATPase|uniref:DNA repair ATPase n=1 Tax=Variovorax TaxID=34072 RepID=UPI00086D4ED1|nr:MULTISPECIES: DNA repair ATPase [Variovorax]MBN8757574.1 DNA repair ATPase [Variovorax sp.]ODU13592.1 MAG: DNA repair protein [Variovorax sp. SCN 67-85]ODV20895.1 MAG: DNA repair protein [Variovorax sp. SCN 67-20]OJZ08084.1 MAG: DNA repair protein [Variovorax sp. 67-131]UKI05592.1 DNA repair ATPase [Variovorax paradoxus]